MTKKRAFIIHGWGASPDSNWFPWLAEELNKNGFEVEVPVMPDTENPDFETWQNTLKKLIVNPDENTYIIGHSLGVITILRFLESLNIDKKIAGAFLVAGFSDPSGYEQKEKFKVLRSFFNNHIDYNKIKESCDHFIAIHSDNDSYIPLEKGKIIERELGAELIIMNNAGHILDGNGNFELPKLLEKILNISK